MKQLLFSVIIGTAVLLAGTQRAEATHAAGADLTYTWLGGNQYRMEVTFYRDCGGIAEPSTVTVNIKSACGHNFNVTATKIPGTGQEITVPCQSSASTCTGGTSVGIRKFEYHATVTLPAACSLWTFSYSVCCRNCPITTIQNPCANSSLIYVESTLNNQVASNNSSPNFTNIPIAFVCIGQTFNYNHGVLDANGDSLVYEFITPKTGATTTVTFIPPATATNPLSSSTPFTLNSQTGQITFTPNQIQIGIMAIRVKEYRNGVLIGSVIRDMQVYTQMCPNQLPTASGINGTSNYSINACPGQQLCFNVTSFDADAGQIVTMTTNNGITGATYTISGSPHPTLNFCWTPTESQVSSLPYTFTVTVKDNACPTNGIQIFSYNIYVTAPSYTVSSTNVTCHGLNNGTATATLQSGGPVTYQWSTTPPSNSSSVSNLSPGYYTVTVTDANGCSVIKNVFIDQPTAINFTSNSTSVTCQGLCNGSVTTSASGGTPGYSYLWSGGQTTANVSGLCAGTYTVTLTDANGCTASTSQTVNVTSNISASVNGTNVLCFGNSTGAATLTVSGGVSPYSYQWSNGANSQNLTNVPAGTYTVTVTDHIGCTRNANVTITQPAAALSGNATVSQAVSCHGGTNGSITLTVSGGTTPYSFNWSNGATTQNIGALSSGTYTVTITDANGCTLTRSATVGQPSAALSATVSSNQSVSCYGGSNGSINITVTGGTPAYSFNWSNGATTQNITGLSAGSYTVTITDANGCTDQQSATVSQPAAPLSGSASASQQVSCYGGVNGSISLTVNGGTPGYSYLWSNGSTLQNPTGLSSGTYTVTVTDSKGCTFSASATVTQPAAALAVTVSSTQNINCYGQSTGSINLNVGGGTPSYSFNWSNGSTTQNLSGVPSGNYTVVVTDANGCTQSASVTLSQPAAPLSSSSTVTQQVSCFGGSNGSIQVTVTGGTPAYTYNWSNGATTQNLIGVSAGTYTVTITDANGCTSQQTRTITQPSASLAAAVSTTQAVSCFGGNNGSITLSVSGGTTPYSYNWSNGATQQNITGLTSGTYTVTVTDANGCTAQASASITQPSAALSASATVTQQVNCFGGNNGSIQVTVSGGTAPYTYNWSSGQTTQNVSGLSSGNYTVTVTDANGCTSVQSATVTQPSAALTSSSTVTQQVSCHGGANGTITVTVSGGTVPYSFSWSNGATTQNLTGVPAGTYTVTITDANGCTSQQTKTITQPSASLSASTQVTSNISCYSGNNGSIVLTVSGGTSPYSYLWNTGSTQQNLTGLAAGNYSVTITDANGCTETASATITQPAGALSASITVSQVVLCRGGNNGSIVLNVGGGTPPYSYLWSNGATTQNLSGLGAGTYTATITDANGCNASISGTITQPAAALTINGNVSSNVSCYGGANGAINITPSGGTPPYTYTWSNGAGTQNISNLSAGTYTVTVADANGCTESFTATVSQPSGALTATLQSSQNVSCYGGANGSIQVNVTQGTAPYSYNWSNGATTQNITNLQAGTYTVTVTDANGCTQNLSATITQPSGALTATLQSSQNVSCYGGANGSIQVNVTQGTAPYSYNWSNGATTQNITNLQAGTYTVTVTDANGCTEVLSAFVNQPSAPLSGSASVTSNISCYAGNNGMIDLTVNGGTAPYTYLWNNGATTQNLNGVSAGTYTVTITDANGCSFSTSATITQPAGALGASVTIAQNVSCFGGNDGSVNLNVTGGTLPYTYNWSNGATTQNISNLSAGVYTVTITDINGCWVTASATIAQPQGELNVNLQSSQNVNCFGGSDGDIQINVTMGTAPYSYLWNTGATTQNLTGVSSGVYTVTVTDANGCTQMLSAYIGQPAAALDVSLNATQNVSCYGLSDGAITSTAVQGTPPYSYLWNTGATTSGISNLPAGTYTVTVTDANGCTETQSLTITQPSGALSVSLQSSQNINCYGGNNGEIILTVLQGTPPYSFNWSNGATTQNINNLVSGTYTVTVTDANGCTETLSHTLSQPAGALSAYLAAQQNVSCYGGSNAIIDVEVMSGTPPYTYLWNTGATTQDLTNVSAGTYTVTVTDANGCTEVLTTTVIQPLGALDVSLTATQNVNCYGNATGSISISVNMGTAPYTFNWSNGATTQNIVNVPAGTYTVTVTDYQGCTETLTATITQPQAALNVSIQSIQNADCFGSNTGSVSINVIQGTPPYTFQWSNGATTQNLSNVTSGIYTVTVTDANGCTQTLTATVGQPQGALSATLQSTQNVGCYGGANGSINIIVTQGTAPYTFNWSNGATTQNISNLSAGTYTVTVTDANGCLQILSATITEPAGALSIAVQSSQNVDCFGGNNGSVTVQVTQGTPPYSYLWNTGATTSGISNLAAGTYTVTVTDANGCTETTSVNISQPQGALQVTLSSTQNVNCYNGADGQISVNVTQGTPPYTYLWNTGATTSGISNLAAGTYTVTVTDANGCTQTLTAVITQPQQALTMTGSTTSSNCLAGTSGSVTISVSGGTAPFTYTWSNGATTQNLNNVSQGSYQVTITDANNCTATSEFTVTDVSSFNAQADGPTTICVGDLAYLIADSIPGATYQWYLNGQVLGGAIYPHFVTPVAGSYTVTIQHPCGTFTSQPIVITVNSVANITVSPNVIICPGESTQLLASGGVNYTWTPATGLDFPNVPNPVASPTVTTTYTVEVQNAEGCRASAQVTVTVFCDTLIIPSGYSPNNDGVNDGFEIVGIEKYPNNKIWIYNRWGNLVYKASGYNNEWNGYSNVSGIYIGKKVPAGTYFYVLDLGDNQKPRQGYIVLRY